MAILSAVLNRTHPRIADMARVAATAATKGTEKDAVLCLDLLFTALARVRPRLREELVRKMMHDGPMTRILNGFAAKARAEGRAQGRAQGRAEGLILGVVRAEATAILTVLEARGVAISEKQRRRIRACSDVMALKRWLRRAATARSTSALFRKR